MHTIWGYNQAMMALLAEQMTRSLVYVLMLVLVVMLLGGILVAWFLGRILGPRSGWRKEIDRTATRPSEPAEDAWSESARRVQLEPEVDLDRPPGWPAPKDIDFDDEPDDFDDDPPDDDAPPPSRFGDR